MLCGFRCVSDTDDDDDDDDVVVDVCLIQMMMMMKLNIILLVLTSPSISTFSLLQHLSTATRIHGNNKQCSLCDLSVVLFLTRSSSADEIANVNFFNSDVIHVLYYKIQKTRT